MCSWKGLLLLACTASLILNVASDDVQQVDADVQVTGDTQDTEETGETGTAEATDETGATGDTTATSDTSCAPRCNKNEVYTDCKDRGCTPYSCSELGFPLKCDSNCKPGCICKDSLLRAENGTCVPREQCPSCGGDENAGPGCGSNCINCANYGKKPVACPLSCILNGCQCKDGYIYDRNIKKCVLPKQCTPTCKKDEVYTDCKDRGCTPYSCSELGFPLKCDSNCKPGCICKDSLLRAANGTCVPQEQCPSCGGDENAGPGCGSYCINCANYGKKPVACPLFCIFNGCQCKDGYIYDRNIKKCVLPKQCTPTCGSNEVYNACTNGGCDARNCSQVGKPVPCVKLKPESCIKGCVCRDGYLRASNGTCVPKNQCEGPPKCNKPNEVYDVCPAPCPPRRCDVDDRLIKCAAPPKPGDAACKPGCRCTDGYARNATGTCVLRCQCEKPLKCKANEVYDSCPAVCPPQKCGIDPALILCLPNPNYGDPACQPGCRCVDGYVRNADNVCIPKNKCPPKCGSNEVYSSCINGGCEARNCSQLGKPVPCVRPMMCTEGCVCAKGYLRDSDGKCVPKDQCGSAKCNKPNEVYDVCPAPCPPRRCDVDDRLIKCAAPPKPGDAACKPGCRCADGYARNATGTCVLRSQCEKPLKCKANEEYDSCPAVCPPQKCGIDPALIDCIPNPNYGDPACQPGCRCVDGYVRNAANVCIPKNKCPPKCGANEVYNSCINGGCDARNCSQLGKPRLCIDPIKCFEGCVCAKGYLRDSDGKCVPTDECGSAQCGENAYWEKCISGCSNQTCDDIGKIFHCPIQPAVCRTGCRCKPGFWRNKDNKCVAENQCPSPPCPEGEIYNRCPTVKCDGDNCPKTRDSPQTCPVGIICDPPRCTCGFNQKRDRKTGKCIATRDCPPFACKGPNEEYQPCPIFCPGENCTDYINDSKCPPGRIGIVLQCRPQCKCKTGYFRNTDGVCIIGSKCGPKKSTTIPTMAVTTPKPTTGDSGSVVASLQAGVTQFTGQFLYDRMKASPGENIILSAYSVFTPLSQLALYATGVSLSQLLAVLNVKSKDDIRTGFPALTASYEGQTSVNFSTATEVCSNVNYKLSDAFKKDSNDIFHAEAKEIDFSKNVEAAALINAWVESKTNNRIKNLVSPDMLSALTRIVLVNAIYFKGNWQYEFDKKNTKDADFYLSDGSTKKTKLMYQKASFKYGEVGDLDCKVIELPYVGKNFTMFIVLPNKNDGVIETADKLRNPANFNKAYESMYSQTVEVYLPPFEITTTTDLADILKKQNVDQIFNERDSGLSGLLDNPEQVSITNAIQKAFIKTDETGSEAAAANGSIGRPGLPAPPTPPPKQFRADHGFLFYIRVKTVTVFCGAYIN